MYHFKPGTRRLGGREEKSRKKRKEERKMEEIEEEEAGCELCGGGQDSVEHFFLECPALARPRARLLQVGLARDEKILQNSTDKTSSLKNLYTKY